jgi:hypothetical protein
MIQRQQTLWLLLATICAFLSYQFPFYTGQKIITPTEHVPLDGGSTFFLVITTAISFLLSLVTIFLFKDRKMQMNLCYIGIFMSVLILLFYFLEIKKLKGDMALSSVFVFAIPISYIMALRGIRKDQKLVKSLDHLR